MALDCAVADKCSGQDCGTSPLVAEAPVAASSSEDPVAKYLCCFPAPHPVSQASLLTIGCRSFYPFGQLGPNGLAAAAKRGTRDRSLVTDPLDVSRNYRESRFTIHRALVLASFRACGETFGVLSTMMRKCLVDRIIDTSNIVRFLSQLKLLKIFLTILNLKLDLVRTLQFSKSGFKHGVCKSLDEMCSVSLKTPKLFAKLL